MVTCVTCQVHNRRDAGGPTVTGPTNRLQQYSRCYSTLRNHPRA
jgi:hypothetical protein